MCGLEGSLTVGEGDLDDLPALRAQLREVALLVQLPFFGHQLGQRFPRVRP